MPKRDQKDPRDDCTYLSDSSNSHCISETSRSQQQTFCLLAPLPKLQGGSDNLKHTQSEPFFLSIGKYYELFLTCKDEKKPPAPGIQTGNSPFQCFCLKHLKRPHQFVGHLQQVHGLEVESLDFLRAKETLQYYRLESMHFRMAQSQYIQKIQTRNYYELRLPEELEKFVSSTLRHQIKKGLRQLVKSVIPSDNFYELRYRLSLSYPKQFLFSRQFMEDIRCLLIKHVTKFDRRVEVHLKNITLKEALFLFLFSCEKAFGEVKQEYFGRRARNRPILEVSRLLECICRHFLSWIDRNYLSIFDKHHVFRSHIELEESEKYTETMRTWKSQLFADEYLRAMGAGRLTSVLFKFAKFLVGTSQLFISNSQKEEPSSLQG